MGTASIRKWEISRESHRAKTALIATAVTTVIWIWSAYGTQTSANVTAKQIRAWQADKAVSDRFVLVDVRDESEHSVSMLPGAITLDEFEASKAKHRDKVVVVYCTVGVRSAKYIAQLRQQDWNAYNYRGGIVDWCQNNLPLVTPDGQPTSRVHTYSRKYSVPASYLAVTP